MAPNAVGAHLKFEVERVLQLLVEVPALASPPATSKHNSATTKVAVRKGAIPEAGLIWLHDEPVVVVGLVHLDVLWEQQSGLRHPLISTTFVPESALGTPA